MDLWQFRPGIHPAWILFHLICRAGMMPRKNNVGFRRSIKIVGEQALEWIVLFLDIAPNSGIQTSMVSGIYPGWLCWKASEYCWCSCSLSTGVCVSTSESSLLSLLSDSSLNIRGVLSNADGLAGVEGMSSLMRLSGVYCTTGQGCFSEGTWYGFPSRAGSQKSSIVAFPPCPFSACLLHTGTFWGHESVLKGGGDGCLLLVSCSLERTTCSLCGRGTIQCWLDKPADDSPIDTTSSGRTSEWALEDWMDSCPVGGEITKEVSYSGCSVNNGTGIGWFESPVEGPLWSDDHANVNIM